MTLREDAITGCLLGTALGDAVGLACEGLTWERQARLFPNLDGPRLVGHRGLVSDDTEHACLVAQALIESTGDAAVFERNFARRLRGWFLTLPAGVGLATLKACLKLCVGIPPERSGVMSAGNGPAMRSALLGVCFGEDLDTLRRLVRASTRVTHTDPRAEAGALAVAVAASYANRPADFLPRLSPVLEDDELRGLLCKAAQSAAAGEATPTFANSLGLTRGVSGYVLHTVPVAVHAWLSHPNDLRAAVLAVVRCGGDTDTTGAIAGAIVGAGVGKDGLPDDWLAALSDWPRTTDWMTRLAAGLARVAQTKTPERALSLPLPAVLARNAVFTIVILAHGFRRLLPPY